MSGPYPDPDVDRMRIADALERIADTLDHLTRVEEHRAGLRTANDTLDPHGTRHQH